MMSEKAKRSGTPKKINVDLVKKFIQYDPESGLFRWLKHPRKNMIGQIAGKPWKTGYLRIYINKSAYTGGRLAWAMTNGDVDQSLEIDHIDRNRLNNKISNLRVVTRKQNCQNRTTPLGEETPRFFTIHKGGKYQVQVKRKYVGLFSTKEEAEKAIEQFMKINEGITK